MADYEIAVAIIFAAVLYFFYRASVDLDPVKHKHARMLMFYAALALGWAASNVALRLTVQASAPQLTEDAVSLFYQAYTWTGYVLVIYLALRFFNMVFHHFLRIAQAIVGRRQKNVADPFNSDGEEW